jgi:hypothetical protein
MASPLLLGGLLAFHFAATLVHLTPMNPLKLRLQPVVDRYINPYFSQKWELFAPDPVVDTKELLVSCRVRRAAQSVEETAWSNMTAPLRQLKYHYRFSPADRLERVQTAALHLAFAPDDPVLSKMRKQRDANEDYRRAIANFDDAKKKQFELAKHLLGRVASAECDRLFGTGVTSAVRVRLLAIEPPPFSKRTLPNESGDAHYFDFDWTPYELVSPI